jgi:predicted transposase YdaD
MWHLEVRYYPHQILETRSVSDKSVMLREMYTQLRWCVHLECVALKFHPDESIFVQEMRRKSRLRIA